jgi:hypothetical protein
MKMYYNIKKVILKKRKLKSLISIILALSIVFNGNIFDINIKASAESLSGSGTLSDPYIITTAEQLASITTNGLSLYYKLGNDIDLSDYTSWAPIGNSSKPFTGTFDGNGFTVNHLMIGTSNSQSSSSYLGLFGYISGATVKNIGLAVSIYSTGKYLGGLAGAAYGKCTITSCSLSGILQGSSYVGGLIGYIDNSYTCVSNSYASDKVTGSNNEVGGLIGENHAVVTNCYATGSSFGNNYVGGLIGYNYGKTINAYSNVSVSGTSYIGGFAGKSVGKVINVYSSGNVTGTSNVGGLVGYNSSYISDGYWNKSVNSLGCESNSGTFSATGVASTDMQTQTFANTLTANIDNLNLSDCACWKYSSNENNGYPVLEGIGNGVGYNDTTLPSITTYEFQNYSDGTETIHATVTDDNSGVAIKKYAAGNQTANYFSSNGTAFSDSIISNLTLGTYTIYAKDNAGNETTKVVTYTAMAGSGATTDPFIIKTALQLSVVSTGLTKCYKLGSDIDLSDYTDWTPIGDSSEPFTGTFDGNGYTVNNLTIGTSDSPSSSSYLGLFGYISGATVKNVGLKASVYSNADNVGGLAGYAYGANTIADCFVSGTIQGSSNVGGLIGYIDNSNTTVSNSYVSANVTGNSNEVGGLIGENHASITNCYASGSVYGNYYIGGLTGNNYGEIMNAYSVAGVSGTSYIGGFAGNNSGKCINVYSSGNVTGTSNVGGLIGCNNSKVLSGYWNKTKNSYGCESNSGTFSAAGMAATDMETQTFADTLTSNIDTLNLSNCACWKYAVDVNNGYPILQGVGDGVDDSDTTPPTIKTYAFQNYADGTETIHAAVKDDNSGIAVKKYAIGIRKASYFKTSGTIFTSALISELVIGTYTIYAKDNAGNETTQVVYYAESSGDGTASNPYIITTKYQLSAISTGLNKCYQLENDIDLSDYEDWTPIGDDSDPFTGTFDGGGFAVTGLSIGTSDDSSGSSYLGLFGYINGATIENVGVSANIYSTGEYVGGIVGFVDGTSSVKNTYVTGYVLGSSYIGGLIGYVNTSSAEISNCYATDTVISSNSYIGGLVGYNVGIILDCYATGNILGSNNIGGNVGCNNGIIRNCYATGNVSGTSYIGGFTGANYATIKNCYAKGNISGTSDIGGFAGYNVWKIINVYASGNVSGSSSVGGLIGFNCYVNSNGYGIVQDGYWNTTARSSGYGSNSGTFTAKGMASTQMQTASFADILNENIDTLNLSDCACWKYGSDVNDGYPTLEGIGDGSGTDDTTAPAITTYTFQDYTKGTETIHATVTDENSGIAVRKYASGTQDASYFESNGITFDNATISGLTIGTYTIYAKDNAGNETTKVVTYTPVSGTGTSSDPYVITTALQLHEISTGLGKCYRLGNDIDVSGYENWTPVGNDSEPFTGTFDGGGFTVTGLLIGTSDDSSDSSYLGLFGYISGATIENVAVQSSIYSTGDDVGGLVGYVTGTSTVKNSFADGTVLGSYYVGGLIGRVDSSNTVISSSYTTASVIGSNNNIGGFTGYNDGTILNCYATGDVLGSSYIGGFTGANHATIKNCYAKGNISGTSDIGGFAGYNVWEIINVYASGNVSGSSSVGGLIGYNYYKNNTSYDGIVQDGYWNTTARSSGYGSNSGTFTAKGMASAQMQKASFADTLNENIDTLNLSDCACWKYGSDVNDGFRHLKELETGSEPTILQPRLSLHIRFKTTQKERKPFMRRSQTRTAGLRFGNMRREHKTQAILNQTE